jgi:predicted esterase
MVQPPPEIGSGFNQKQDLRRSLPGNCSEVSLVRNFWFQIDFVSLIVARLLSDLFGSQIHWTNPTDTTEEDGSITAALDAGLLDGQLCSQGSYILSSCSESHPALRSSSLPHFHTAEISPGEAADHTMQHQTSEDGNISQSDIPALRSEQIRASASAQEPSDAGPSESNTFVHNFSESPRTPRQIPRPPFAHRRLPVQGDFQEIALQVTYDLIPHPTPDTESDVKHIVLVLHDYDKSEESLADFTKSCLVQPDTAYLLLRAPKNADKGYTWSDAARPEGTFLEATQTVISIIRDVLVLKCLFPLRNILLFGYGQGGTVALAVAAEWREIELGGIMSIAGPMPSAIQADGKKIKTPALVIGGSLGNITAQAEQHIRDLFLHVEVVLKTGFGNFLPKKDEMGRVDAFFAHRLRREEWTKRAILTLGELVSKRKNAIVLI